MVLSADDVLIRDDKLQSQVDFLEGNKKFVACCTDFELFWPDGQHRKITMRASLSRLSFWATQYMHISCFVFRRDLLLFLKAVAFAFSLFLILFLFFRFLKIKK